MALACLAFTLTACSAPGPGENASGGSGQSSRRDTPQTTAAPHLVAPAPTTPATTTPLPATTVPPTTPPTTAPPSTPPRDLTPATTRYVSPPALAASNGDGSAASPWNDFCYALGHVRTGDLLVVAGTRITPFDMDNAPTTSASSECRIGPSATDVIVWGQSDPLVKGALILNGAIRWTFDNIDETRSTRMGHQELVNMIGGTGWRWTNCDLWGAQAFSNFSVGNWGGVVPPTDFRIDHCFIHDNPGWAAGGHSPFQDHNMYIFTVDGIDAHGVIEDNVIVAAPGGLNVKIGGTGNASDEGSDGITLRRNVLVNNSADGANLNVCTNSDAVKVSNNLFVSQAQSTWAVNIALGSFTGSGLALTDNMFWGYDATLAHPEPILWASGTGLYDQIDLNQPSGRLTQLRSVHADPGYGPLGSSNSRSSFPSPVRNGVTYGPTS